MDNYHKYLPVSEEEKNWGLCVLNAGYTRIDPFCSYPFKSHPSHHNFNWYNGRTLQEYQIIYIARGQGCFESNAYKSSVLEEGTVIMLFPGEWHRYKPNENTGWDEYWIGISGPIIDNLLSKKYFKKDTPLLRVGYNDFILSLFDEIIETSKQEKPGFQSVISGAAFHLLGYLNVKSKEYYFEDNHLDIIKRSKTLFRINIGNIYSPEDAALELQVGYSWFRKTFKSQTGMAPGQYFIDLKIQRAKELLCNPNCVVKNIAIELRFDSVFYFSKIFKEKTGLSPIQFKNLFSQGKTQLFQDNSPA